MMRLTRLLLLVLVLAAFGLGAAKADDFDLPGLGADSQAYVNGLTKRHPAGGTPQARIAAEQQAAAALQRKDLTAAAAALEERVSLGDPTPKQWLDLANAMLHKAPPDPKHALDAGWQAYIRSDNGEPAIPSLLLLAEALRAMDRQDQAAQALEQVVQRAPDNTRYQGMLTEARRAAGLIVRGVQTEAEADPPRACIGFSVPPTTRGDFNAQDWVRLDPPVPGAAVTREADQICVSGLPTGETTRLILRAGLPGEDGLSLAKDTALTVAMPNRPPGILFDTRLYVLPRGQATSVTLTTTNVSSVKLRLLRLTERNTVAFLRDNKLGDAIEDYATDTIAETLGSVVWEGTADIAKGDRNTTQRTALPIPDALTSAGPGLYALEASAGDGTPDVSPATQMILRTDLAPTAWRGADGLTVQVRGYSDAHVRPGVRLALLAHNNNILGEVTTDADGLGHFPKGLMDGDGPMAPAVVHAFAGDDFAALDLNGAAFDLSDRGVAGAPQPGPLDAFVWLDRGIYRPGETVQVMAMLRDNAGQPVDFPARVTIRRPNGLVFLETTPARLAEDAVYLPVQLSAGAPVGTWTVEIRADPDAPPVGTAEFRVDAFVPDRMAVDVGPVPPALVVGQPATLPVTARFLYGAPAANLSGSGGMDITLDPAPFPDLAGWHIGLADEAFAPDHRDLQMADTDDKGHSAVTLLLDTAPDTTRPLKADIEVEVDDPSGHAARAKTTIPIRSANPLIAIKPAFDDGSVDANSEAAFDVVAVNPEGGRIAMPVHVRLVRERPNWRIVRRGNLARYESVWRDEPLETKDVTIAADQPLHISRKLDFGRYRVEVAQAGGMAISSYRFYSGWVTSQTPDVPDRVVVSTDRKSIPPGETAHIHIAAPFAGDATLLVMSDRVLSVRALTVAADGTDVDVPVDASWGPGAYVAVHLYRGGGGGAPGTPRPDRAIGLVWVGVDPAARTLPLAIQAADKYKPRGRVTIPVKTAPGAWVTLAAVDEGILRLTNFASPDAAPHFLGRRSLGIDIRDDWGRLIDPADGEPTQLRQGGDEDGNALPEIPQHTVTLFTPPMQADADGMVRIPLDLPDFNGQIRLMAVGWQGNRIGSASTDAIVRDALVAEPLLPRFLAPGDQARMAVLMNNLDLSAGDATVKITVDGPLAVLGASTLGAHLAVGQQVVAATVLRATGAGRGVIHLDVSGPDNFHIQREAAILIRPARGAVFTTAGQDLPPGGEAPLPVATSAYFAGTWRAGATFGAPVRYDVTALVDALADYPLSCLEQATSRGLPLAMLPSTPDGQRAGLLGIAVGTVLNRQRFDGGFGLWSSSGDAEPWLSSYATEFLVRAQRAGALVPEQALRDAVKFAADATDADVDTPDGMAEQAYRLYALALARHGKPGLARVLFESLDKLPTPLAKAQLGAALALGHDTVRAQAAFTAALASTERTYWHVDYGSSLRDLAAITVLLKESGLLPDRLARLQGLLPGANLAVNGLSTQEWAWLAAAGAALGRDGRPTRIAVDGRPLDPAAVVQVALTGPAQAKNLGDRAVWQSVTVRGVPTEAPPASRAGMRVSRHFYTLDGGPLDLDQLKQNTVFVLLVEGRAEDGQDHQAMMLQGLPAGWEIAGRFPEGKQPGMDWLGELSATDAQPASDDRFAAVLSLTGAQPAFRVAVRLRAVTPGDYEMPGAELSDMYRPAVYARQGDNRGKVLAPE